MAAETRILRPYTGLEQLQHVLDGVELRWGADELLPGRRAIRARDYRQEPVDLLLPDDAGHAIVAALDAVDVPPDAVRLHVITRSTRLRWSEVIWSCDAQNLPSVVRLAEVRSRPATFRTPHSGTSVHVVLTLDRELEPRALQPYRIGTWLARTQFDVVTDLNGDGITPLPMTDADRERLGVPKGTLHHFSVEGPLEPGGADQALTIWVDESLLATLDDRATEASAKMLQQELFVDAMRAVISAVSREADDGLTLYDVEGSLAARISMMLAGEHQPGRASEAVFRRMRLQPELVAAAVEAHVPDLLKYRMNALGG